MKLIFLVKNLMSFNSLFINNKVYQKCLITHYTNAEYQSNKRLLL